MRWDSLGSDQNREHSPTLKDVSGLDDVRYIKEPIIPQYFVSSIVFSSWSLSNFKEDCIGVAMCLALFIPNFFNNSFVYFSWLRKISSIVCLICSPKKKDSPPIILISNSLAISLEILVPIMEQLSGLGTSVHTSFLSNCCNSSFMTLIHASSLKASLIDVGSMVDTKANLTC